MPLTRHTAAVCLLAVVLEPGLALPPRALGGWCSATPLPCAGSVKQGPALGDDEGWRRMCWRGTSFDWNEKMDKAGEVDLEVMGGEMGSTGM